MRARLANPSISRGVSVRYAVPYTAGARDVAHRLKRAEVGAVEWAAERMAPLVSRIGHPVYVPAPDSRGGTDANFALAEAIAQITSGTVCDVLRRDALVESSYLRGKRGLDSLQPIEHRIVAAGVCEGRVFVVDNVAAAGNTLEAAVNALGGGEGLVYAADVAVFDRGRRNPARAHRRHLREKAQLVPSRSEHFRDPETRAAQAYLRALFAGEGKLLGAGNFGSVYQVRDKAVKVGSRETVHTRRGWGKQRTKKQIRDTLMHEAGVANELWTAGHRVVPETVYAEHKGVAALVREYGELGDITPVEYDQLSLDLMAAVMDGWRVQDELLVARRPDGSLFVADVGIWQPWGRGRGIYRPEYEAPRDLFRLLKAYARTQPWGVGRDIPSSAEMAFLAEENGRLNHDLGDAELVQVLVREFDDEQAARQAVRAEVGL